MRDILLILLMAGVFVFGIFVMRAIGNYINKMRKK